MFYMIGGGIDSGIYDDDDSAYDWRISKKQAEAEERELAMYGYRRATDEQAEADARELADIEASRLEGYREMQAASFDQRVPRVSLEEWSRQEERLGREASIVNELWEEVMSSQEKPPRYALQAVSNPKYENRGGGSDTGFTEVERKLTSPAFLTSFQRQAANGFYPNLLREADRESNPHKQSQKVKKLLETLRKDVGFIDSSSEGRSAWQYNCKQANDVGNAYASLPKPKKIGRDKKMHGKSDGTSDLASGLDSMYIGALEEDPFTLKIDKDRSKHIVPIPIKDPSPPYVCPVVRVRALSNPRPQQIPRYTNQVLTSSSDADICVPEARESQQTTI